MSQERSWSGRTFTSVQTPAGLFDAIVCNNLHKHGQTFRTILVFTLEANRYFEENRANSVSREGNLLKLPRGIYEGDGRSVSYFG